MGRRVLAAIAGGVVVFVWSALSHTALGLGTAGISTIPNEERVAQALRGAIAEPGLYFLPGFDTSHKMTAEEQKAWTEKYRRGPSGILVIQPGGRDPMMPEQLVVELVADILAAGVAAFILGAIGVPGPGHGRRPDGRVRVARHQRLVLELVQVPHGLHGRVAGRAADRVDAGLVMALILRSRSGPIPR